MSRSWRFYGRPFTKYWDSLEQQPDGSIIVTFTIPNLEIAASMVMTYGYRAAIIKPEELRELVRERAGTLAARNDPTNKSKEKQI